MFESEIIFIVRESGENTKFFLLNQLKENFSNENVIVVREKPFEDALRSCFGLMANESLPFTVTIDADIILDIIGFTSFIQSAIHNFSLNPKLLMQQPYIYDHNFAEIRQAGVRIYRNSFASKLLNAVPSNGITARPETETISRVLDQFGLCETSVKTLVGLHDFFQTPLSIFKTSVLLGFKFKHKVKRSVKRISKSSKPISTSDLYFINGLLVGSKLKTAPTANELYAMIEDFGFSFEDNKFSGSVDEFEVNELLIIAYAKFKYRYIHLIFNRLDKYSIKLRNFF